MSDCIKKGIIEKECLCIAAQLFLIFPQINWGACILFFFGQQLRLYLGIYDGLLRFLTSAGKLVPTPEEVAEKLATKLRELNIYPDAIEFNSDRNPVQISLIS